MINNIVELFVTAAAAEYVSSYHAFVEADRSYDAGEWSDAERTVPLEVCAGYEVLAAAGWLHDDDAIFN